MYKNNGAKTLQHHIQQLVSHLQNTHTHLNALVFIRDQHRTDLWEKPPHSKTQVQACERASIYYTHFHMAYKSLQSSGCRLLPTYKLQEAKLKNHATYRQIKQIYLNTLRGLQLPVHSSMPVLVNTTKPMHNKQPPSPPSKNTEFTEFIEATAASFTVQEDSLSPV